MREARDSVNLSLEEAGILIRFDPADIRTAYVCLVGPEETPYEHCFFLFKFVLAYNHPISPPTATYLTNNGTTRFHPNLYVDGKVCLSILNTWQGPAWLPATLDCVVRTIRTTVLNDTPLRCEPGYEGNTIKSIAPYSLFVEFHSLDFSLTQAIRNPPDGFSEFQPHFTKYFIDHMDFYMAKLEWLAAKGEGSAIRHPYQSSSVIAHYRNTITKLKQMYTELAGSEWVGKEEAAAFDPGKRNWYPGAPE
jgi:ubiquitin-conjugating enzyme E2 Z